MNVSQVELDPRAHKGEDREVDGGWRGSLVQTQSDSPCPPQAHQTSCTQEVIRELHQVIVNTILWACACDILKWNKCLMMLRCT